MAAASIAVLTSGGLDSAILVAELGDLGDLGERHARVFPIYIRAGLAWEAVELGHLRRFLEVLNRKSIQPLVVLDVPVADLYGSHWSLTGEGVPDADSPDEAVFLPGRNLLLLSKALLWCHLHAVPALAIGVLKGNPFPDAGERFFERLQETANLAMSGRVEIVRPYGELHKADVLRRGRGLPLEWTFSCIRPAEGRHCGACNKCAERQKAFAAEGWPDPTVYANAQ